MKRFIINIFICISAVLVLTGCFSVPYTNRSQIIMISQGEEKKLGVQAWQDTQKTEKLSTNIQYNQALQRIGYNLAAVSEKTDYEWEFKVFDSDEVNAFCLPGGKVAVYSGLFKLADNDAEMAAVVGHEIAHALARHGAERMSQDTINQLGMNAVGLATGNTLYTQAYGLITQSGVILPYSRLHEYEADYIGLILMAKAGYDPNAALTLWEKFKMVTPSDSLFGDFFQTHPMSEKRIEQFKEKLPEAVAIYNNIQVKRGIGYKYR